MLGSLLLQILDFDVESSNFFLYGISVTGKEVLGKCDANLTPLNCIDLSTAASEEANAMCRAFVERHQIIEQLD